MKRAATAALFVVLAGLSGIGVEAQVLKTEPVDSWGFRAGVGYSEGFGDYYDGIEDSWGETAFLFLASREFHMHDSIYLEPGLGIIRNGTGLETWTTWVDIYVTYAYIPLTGKVKLEFAERSYFTLGGGFALKLLVDASGVQEDDYDLSDDFFDDLNDGVLATHVFMGLEFPINDRASIGPELYLDSDLTDTWDSDDDSMFISFGLAMGVRYR